MSRLVYVVDVQSDDEETDIAYLQKVRETFQLITEGLKSFGYTDDESICFSNVDKTEEKAMISILRNIGTFQEETDNEDQIVFYTTGT